MVPSFKSKDICLDSNIVGTLNVIKYALRKKSKLIYSASSIHWGIKYHSLSPYAWTKSKNVELIENFSLFNGKVIIDEHLFFLAKV